MKHIHYIVLVVLIGVLVACEDDNGSQLITSTTQLSFPPDGGSQTILIESNCNWHIVSNDAWVSAYPVKGNSTQEVTITVAIKDNKLEQETRLIVMTDDGSKVVNVSVKVEGAQIKNGKHLDIRVDDKTFSGKAGAVDSLEITSNINWEVLGPEWLEAWDGARWRPLSADRGIIKGNGKKTLFVRTAFNNKNEESLEDVIIVRECLTGDFAHTVNVEQVGRMAVSSLVLWDLEDGLAFDWHCGCDVSKIYFTVNEGVHPFDINVIRNTYTLTDESFINSAVNLKPGSKFSIVSIGEDIHGNMANKYYTTYGVLPEETAPVAEISSGLHVEEGLWRFFIRTNILTEAYHLYVTDRSNSAFMYSDPILWHIAMTNNNKKYWFQEGTGFTSTGWVLWNNLSGKTDEIHAIACATAEIGGQPRPKVFRYDRYYDEDGKRLPDKPLLDRIPKAMVDDPSLR